MSDTDTNTDKDITSKESILKTTEETNLSSMDHVSPNTSPDPLLSTKSSRIVQLMRGNGSEIFAKITHASVSNDMHSHLQGYVVYLIQVGLVSVRRRYSEFEALRTCLVKQFPTLIIPPIPEKQSLKSNITQTTSKSLGFATSSITSNLTDSTSTIRSTTDSSNSHFSDIESSDAAKNESGSVVSLIEYRKRMLGAFLNKCLGNLQLLNSKFLVNFLDPEINYFDYVQSKENEVFFKTSIYQLSPRNPIEDIENQIYLTLPMPSSSDAHFFKELAEEEQFQKFVCFESKFLKYELVLNNISKLNKHLVKHTNELSIELSELGAQFNQLSITQDSDSIEKIGKLLERHTILLSSLSSSINVGFLDKLIELKNFSTTCKGLMEYNRKKIIQFKLVEKELYNVRSRYKRYENEEIRIRKIDRKADIALRNTSPDLEDYVEPPITNEELQTALYSKSFNKSIYGKIPGMNKFNNMILKYINDPNPDETRRTKFYNMKIRLFQLERQYSYTQSDLMQINLEVMKQLEEFHSWFKHELCKVTISYQEFLSLYFKKGLEPWKELEPIGLQ